MKLLIITAITEFDNDVKHMLKQAEVKSFTYKEVKGHKDHTNQEMKGNWFAKESVEVESTLFYVFIEEKKIDKLFDLVGHFNEQQETVSNIHLAVLNIEKYN